MMVLLCCCLVCDRSPETTVDARDTSSIMVVWQPMKKSHAQGTIVGWKWVVVVTSRACARDPGTCACPLVSVRTLMAACWARNHLQSDLILLESSILEVVVSQWWEYYANSTIVIRWLELVFLLRLAYHETFIYCAFSLRRPVVKCHCYRLGFHAVLCVQLYVCVDAWGFPPCMPSTRCTNSLVFVTGHGLLWI